MQPLKIQARCVVDAQGRLDHIKSALERGLDEFGPSPPHDKEICIARFLKIFLFSSFI